MACGKTLSPVSKHLVTTSITETVSDYTGWMSATGADKIKGVLKRASVQLVGTAPTMSFRLCIQTATVRTDDPGAWVPITGFSAVFGAGESPISTQDITSYTAGQAWFRVGVMFALAGTTPKDGQADVELTLVVQTCGQSVGSTTQELVAFNTTSPSFVAVTGYLPTLLIDKVVAFFTLSGVLNTFQCRLCYRIASTSTSAPGAWTLLESSYRSTNGDSSTGELPLTFGSEMFVQFGVAYCQLTAGSVPGQATVTVAVATRRS